MKVLKGIAEIRGAMIGNSKMLVIVGFHSSGYRERWGPDQSCERLFSGLWNSIALGLLPRKKVGSTSAT